MKIQSILLAGLLATLGACTDLSETLYDKIDANEYGQTDAQIASIVGALMPRCEGAVSMVRMDTLLVSMCISSRRSARTRRCFPPGTEALTGMMADGTSS